MFRKGDSFPPACVGTTKPSSRDAAGSGAFPSSLLLTEPFGQAQQVGQVPAGLLGAVQASGRERVEQRLHSGADGDTHHYSLLNVGNLLTEMPDLFP